MLSKDAVLEWSESRPWKQEEQIEQDLLLEMILHQVASTNCSEHLAFIGGTCIHKLHVPHPPRYSEDLDFTWLGEDSVDGALVEIAKSCSDLGFEKIDVADSNEARFPKVLFFYTTRTGSPGKIKLDTNSQHISGFKESLVKRTLMTTHSHITATSEIACAPLPALAGMKVVAGSTRRKARDLYDLDYMFEHLGISSDEAARWARRIAPDDWKPARRHRFVKRTVQKPAYWQEMDRYLQREHYLDVSDRTRMASGMLDLLSAMQKPEQPSKTTVVGLPFSHDELTTMASSGGGVGLCGAPTKTGETCQNPHPGPGGTCAAGHRR